MKQYDTSKYGCYNREPFIAVISLSNGISIPQTMARDCQFTQSELGQADQRCAGCKHQQKETQCGTQPQHR